MIKDCYFRVDADNMIGTGHLVRSEILADELSKNNYQIYFLCRSIPKNYSDNLKSKNYQVLKLNSSEPEQDVLLDVIEKKR